MTDDKTISDLAEDERRNVDRLEIPATIDDAIGDLDLTKDEKLRVCALLLAIQYHLKTIIADADYLKVMIKNDMHLEPTTADKVVRQAQAFEAYLRG